VRHSPAVALTVARCANARKSFAFHGNLLRFDRLPLVTGVLVNTHDYTDFAPPGWQARLSSSRPGSEEIASRRRPTATITPRTGSRIGRQGSTHDDTYNTYREACSVYMLAKISAATLRLLEFLTSVPI